MNLLNFDQRNFVFGLALFIVSSSSVVYGQSYKTGSTCGPNGCGANANAIQYRSTPASYVSNYATTPVVSSYSAPIMSTTVGTFSSPIVSTSYQGGYSHLPTTYSSSYTTLATPSISAPSVTSTSFAAPQAFSSAPQCSARSACCSGWTY